jgi:hypothetical protein
VPGKKHGSSTGDRGHGGKDSRYDGPLTPLGRFSKLFVTDPNWIPFFNVESSDDDFKEGRQTRLRITVVVQS